MLQVGLGGWNLGQSCLLCVYPEPSKDAESLIANSTSGTKSAQSLHLSLAMERRTSAMTPLTGSVVVVLEAEVERRSKHLVQTCPEGARKARVAIRNEDVGQPHVAEYRGYEVAARSLRRGGLHVLDKPDAACQEIDVHLHEVMTRAGAAAR